MPRLVVVKYRPLASTICCSVFCRPNRWISTPAQRTGNVAAWMRLQAASSAEASDEGSLDAGIAASLPFGGAQSICQTSWSPSR